MIDRDRLPTKLKNDAILEAVVEIRFEPDPSLVPEIFIGRFADNQALSGFRHARLASADIPAQIRQADPNLRYRHSASTATAFGRAAQLTKRWCRRKPTSSKAIGSW